MKFAETSPSSPSAASPKLFYKPLPYNPIAGAKPQPILRGRTVLHPEIGLNSFKCKAVIDWLKLRLETPGFHQAVNIHAAVKKMLLAMGSESSVFVTGPKGFTGYKGHHFTLTIQQPEPNELKKLLQMIVDRYDPHAESLWLLQIAGIEISVDFFVRPSVGMTSETADLMRWQMTDNLRRHIRPEPILTEEDRCHPRFFSKENGKSGATFTIDRKLRKPLGSALAIASKLSIDKTALIPIQLGAHHQPPVDRTSWIGDRDDVVLLRIMDKVTDRRNPTKGTACDLPPELRRARIEVTLQGSDDQVGGHGAFGLNTIGDLYNFRFKTLRSIAFEFFLPTFASVKEPFDVGCRVTANESDVFRRSGVYRLDRLHRTAEAINLARYKIGDIAEPPAKLRKKGRLVSFTDLNRKMERALKALVGKWSD